MTGLEPARDAAAAGAWHQVLEALVGVDDHSDEALELRAMALYAAGDLEGCITAYERHHAQCAASGQRERAARAAAMVALFLLVDTGLLAPVRGWLTRAERMVADAPSGPVHAMIVMIRTDERLLSGDLDAARKLAPEAVQLGELHDVPQAVVMGKVAQARLLVLDGSLDDGLRALDEAGARLLSGEFDPLTTGMMLCEIVCAAQGLARTDLAREWTDLMEQWRGGAAFGGIHGRCRVHRAEMLRTSGPCDAAEEEALAACAELRPWMRREYGWPLAELGTIRLRKGDLAGAEDAFAATEALVWSAEPGRALLRLAQGDVDTAAALIADAIAHPMDIPFKERPPSGDLRLAPLLSAQAEITAALGDGDTCGAAAEELTRIALAYPSRSLEASAALAQARASLLAGEPTRARDLANHAAELWADLSTPFESAAARVVAGDASAAAGDRDAARAQWEIAQRAFADYGAVLRAEETRTRLGGALTVVSPRSVVARFHREGQIRVVAFAGPDQSLPDLLGFRYIELLIRRVGDEVAAAELVAIEQPGAQVNQLGLPALDDAARDAYRRRLADIEEDIAEATDMNDPVRVEHAQRDRDFLLSELARAVGVHGRIRTVGGDAERARTSVFRAIRYAIDRLADVEPSLAEHLRNTVRTGTLCSYWSDPVAPVRWQL